MENDYQKFLKKWSFLISIKDLKYLSKDYWKEPLKRKQSPNKEDLRYLFLTLNLPLKFLGEYFHRSKITVNAWLRKFAIRKTRTQINELSLKVNMYKYGVVAASQLPKTKQKAKQTSLRKYGVENCSKLKNTKEKVKQTCLKKYGVPNAMQSEEVKQRLFKTNFGRYGVKICTENENIKQKLKNSVPNMLEKKRKKGTYQTSKLEEDVFKLLCEKFKKENILRQHMTKEYPFPCDFYIISKSLYIEFQGSWFHGKESFNGNNQRHLKQVDFWKRKDEQLTSQGNKKHSYQHAIQIWTDSDVKKRNYAFKNKLNWIEFFNFKQFLKWFKKQ